jgi:2-amino-4-hydroxy-6-hydroxymethyldihydropteridine diphosphokinase
MAERRHRAALSLGSNRDAAVHLPAAIAALRERFTVLAESPLYRNQAVGFAGADFFNSAVIIDGDLEPLALHTWLHALEAAHGRRRDQPRFSDRPLDIDIVLFDDLVLNGPGPLQIPRAELQYAFVLKPLVDIAPDWALPGGGPTLAELWAAHADHDDPRWAAES